MKIESRTTERAVWERSACADLLPAVLEVVRILGDRRRKGRHVADFAWRVAAADRFLSSQGGF